jgi:pimeloyl-ACP methyl ester carboxylesterase
MGLQQNFTTGTVTSQDGTTIGYRQIGRGPGIVLVHGAMMTSQNFMKLATALSDAFTLYIPDRRGRGLSGPQGQDQDLAKEAEDMQALVQATHTHNIFGLSSGAIIALQTALVTSSLRKVAVYEPPLPVSGRESPRAWAERYDRELAQGKLAEAMVTTIKGTGDSLMTKIPRFVWVPLLTRAISAESVQTNNDMAPLKTLIPTVHYDTQIVKELEDSLERFRAIHAEVLLLGGSRSRTYLKTALDALAGLLPQAKRIEFKGVGHLASDNSGKPDLVARELRPFFNE